MLSPWLTTILVLLLMHAALAAPSKVPADDDFDITDIKN